MNANSELYHVSPVPHSNGLMIAYIPGRRSSSRRLLAPCSGATGYDHVKPRPDFEKLNLDFDRYINVHTSAAPQTKADLWKAVGNKKVETRLDASSRARTVVP